MHIPYIEFSDSTGLYFYSALLQANAAILSIMGVFYIFRIQLLKSEIESIKNYVLGLILDNLAAKKFYFDFDIGDIDTKHKILEQIKKKGLLDISAPFGKFPIWMEKEIIILKVIKSIKSPTIIIATTILCNTVGLIFASQVHKLPYPNESICFALTLFLQIVVLIFVLKSIFNIVSITPKKQDAFT